MSLEINKAVPVGYNTPVLILNDAMHNLKTDPNVGSKLYDAIGQTQLPAYREKGVSFSIGNHANGGHVLRSMHADDVQIIAVGGNYIRTLGINYRGWSNMLDSVAMCKALADSLGYRLVKKPD